MKLLQLKKYLLLIDEEAEIKDGGYVTGDGIHYLSGVVNKVTQIHNGGIIVNNFTKMSMKGNLKIIAYYPLTKEAKELDLPLLPDPFEDSFDITSWAKDEHKYNHRSIHELSFILGCEVGYKEARSKQFSLEDIQKAFEAGVLTDLFNTWGISKEDFAKEKAEQYIQSLSTQQLPKEFIPKYEANIDNSPYTSIKMNKALKALKESSKIGCKLKTITNSEGKEILVGTYKY